MGEISKVQVDFETTLRFVASHITHSIPYSERRSRCTGHPWTVGTVPLGPLLGQPLWTHTGPRMCIDRRQSSRGLRAAQLLL